MSCINKYETKKQWLWDWMKGERTTPSISLTPEKKLHWFSNEKDSARPGDIACWSGTKIYFVKPGDYNNAVDTNPIGVVFCPTFLTKDGTVRIISLCNMSARTAYTGTLDTGSDMGIDQNLPWGPGIGISDPKLKQFDRGEGAIFPILNNDFTDLFDQDSYGGQVVYGSISSDGVPSVRFEEGNAKIDTSCNLPFTASINYPSVEEAIEDGDSNWVMPNPYIYPQLYLDPDYIMSDFDGKHNTEVILEKIGSINGLYDPTTGALIGDSSNNPYTHCYPAILTCHLFSTVGTELGDWYLPSIGELGVLGVWENTINESFKLLESNGLAVQLGFYTNNYSDYGTTLFSSTTGHGSDMSRFLVFNTAEVDVEQGYFPEGYRHYRIRAALKI